MISRVVILVLVLDFTALMAAAQPTRLDPEISTPYTWQIYLHTKPHPLLSQAFRTDVQRDVLASLQPLMGPLGAVEVVDLATLPRDQWPTLAKDYEARGWQALDSSHLRELTGTKTQILHLELRGNEYHLESRQLDGFTGLPLPLLRRQTRLPEMVGRLAGLMLDCDFAPVGTLELPITANGDVTIRLRGSALGSLDRFVQPGDVFAVAGIRKSVRPAGPPPVRSATGKVKDPIKEVPPAFTAVSREFTLLKAAEAPKDGMLRCKVFTGYPAALPLTNGVLGYRCVKLPTVASVLAIRLVGRNGGTPRTTSAASIRASDIGWGLLPGSEELQPREGVFRSAKPLTNLAFVTLTAGPTRSARVPIPVLGNEPIEIPFNLDPADETRIAFERDCNDLVRKVADARTTQNGYFSALKTLMEAQQNGEALRRARAAISLTEADEKELTAAHARLKDSVVLSPTMGPLLAACDRQIADLRASLTELVARTADLDQIVMREKDPLRVAKETQAESLNTRIKLLLERGDVDEALTLYEQLTTLLPGNTEVMSRREKLREEWKPKSDAHAKARDYLVNAWPALSTIPDLKESLKTLEASVEECIRQKDRYTCRKLMTSLAVLAVKVNDLTQSLDRTNDAERMLLADAQTVIDTVAMVEAKVREFLKTP